MDASTKARSTRILLVAWFSLSALALGALAWAGQALAWYFSHSSDPQRHEALEGTALILAFGAPVFLGAILTSRRLAATRGNGYYLAAFAVSLIAISEAVLVAVAG